MKSKNLILFFFILIPISILSQEDLVNKKEKKYLHHYFLAEKYKVLDEVEKAKLQYEICIKENPKESAPFYELSKISLSRGEFNKAKEYIIDAKNIDPQNIWYLYLLIEIYNETYEIENQAEIWEDLIKINPENKLYHFEAIYSYINLGQLKKAVKLIKKAKHHISNIEDLVILESEVYEKNNNLEKATEIIRLESKKNPNNLKYLQRLSEIYILRSEYDLANKAYEQILNLDPENPIALLASFKINQTTLSKNNDIDLFLRIFNSSKISKEQKIDILFEVFSDTKKTEKYNEYIPKVLDVCIKQYSDEVVFYVILGDYKLLVQDYEGALDNYISSIEYGLKDKVIYEKILNIYLYKNEIDKVVIYSDKALSYFSFEPIFYYYKSIAQKYKLEYSQSNETLIKGLEFIFDESTLKSEMYSLMGDNYHKLNNNKESDKYYDLALNINPEYILVLNNYSYYLSLRGGSENLLKAEKMIMKCLELTKEDPQPSFLDTYAWVLYKQALIEKDSKLKQEKLSLSKKTMDECFDFGGNSAVIFEHYGDILFQLNDFKGAKEYWKKAIKIDSGNKKIEEKIKNL
jgi:tetratricopeptide (TPR) repeat protein